MSSNKTIGVFARTALPKSQTFIADHVDGISRRDVEFLTFRTLPHGIITRVMPRVMPRVMAGCALETAQAFAFGRVRPEVDVVLRELGLIHAHFLTEAAFVHAIARRRKLPLVVTAHGYDACVTFPHRIRSKLGAVCETRRRAVVRDAAAIVCVSDFIADTLVEAGVSRDKLTIVENSVPDSFFVEKDETEPRILFVGRLVEKKGVPDLLEAFARVRRTNPKATLDIVGDGPLRSVVEKVSADRSSGVYYHGARPREAVHDLLMEARMVVIPSMPAADGDNEGMPIFALEAMASGTPVVCYRQGPMTSLFARGEGFHCNPGDVVHLAATMIDLTLDADLAAGTGRAASAMARHRYRLKRQIAELEDLYDRVSR